jgi:hypothetical protein
MRRGRWRFYETASGAKPVQAFLDNLIATEAAEVAAAMKEVARHGLRRARARAHPVAHGAGRRSVCARSDEAPNDPVQISGSPRDEVSNEPVQISGTPR